MIDSARKFIDMKANGLNNYVIFTDAHIVFYLIHHLSSHAKEVGYVAFVKSLDYFERLVVFPMRRSLDEKRKRFINDR